MPGSVSISPDGKAVAVLLPSNNAVEIYRLGKKPGDEASCVLTISNVSLLACSGILVICQYCSLAVHVYQMYSILCDRT